MGQGELKAGGFDPLFSLNHTCAMYRDNLTRMSRRTWCTTKGPDRLQSLVNLYVCAHNFMIDCRRPKTEPLPGPGFLEPTPGADVQSSLKLLDQLSMPKRVHH